MTRGSVAAVVPNFNYAAFLPARIASLRAQTRPVGQLVFLDDASTDASVAVATPLLAAWPSRLVERRNARNSGSVLRQWALGAELADADYTWIAEADDDADPALVEALAGRLDADPDAILAFADSAAIGTDGRLLAADSKEYTTAFDDALRQDGAFPGADALRRILCPRNGMVSASAILWRTAALRAALAAVADEIPEWLCCGDWRVYAEACRRGGRVHYVARPLNLHRRHDASLTGRTPRARHFAEVAAMLALLRREIGAEAGKPAEMRRHLAMLRRAWRLDEAA
jgi:glycosyltransferase involved in cell wall biosynthesis